MSYNEVDIEKKIINKLKNLKYIYRSDIKDRDSLEKNFRQKFEELNKVKLTDSEFNRLLEQIISPDVFKTSTILRNINTFIRDDGTSLNYTLVNIRNWCKNSFEVVNQLRINTKSSYHRYDVILLINGLPLVQIELKSMEISPRRAMEQIVRYKKDPGNGYTNTLLSFMQIFIVSNQTDTLYFANNSIEHFKFDANELFLPVYRFAAPDNKKITHLYEFADKFFSKCELAETISRYMVLVETERKILMMRPYQIYAVKEIINTIHENRGNGYIWHTTGSGKTLTSFKASTLLKENPDIEKCIFVVDRKDLDKQTREEFNKFQPGCVEENTNTETLVKRLLSTDYKDKVIVTTIQKLGIALDENHRKEYKKRLEPLKNKRMVFIFDECHRSQFGENHKAIKEFFPKAQLFGFTGTPIFKENSTYQFIKGQKATFKTTDDVFEKRLHTYTITHAIADKNVLRFRVEYFKPDNKNINPEHPQYKKEIIKTILKKHDAVTNNRKFNAIFATASIDDSIEYYKLFDNIQNELKLENPDFEPLNITCVFTPPSDVSPDVKQLQEDLPQEIEDNKKEPNKKKEALKEIIKDYNKKYGTNFNIYDFDLYYKDVQQRIKDQRFPNKDYPHSKKLDITIVVDMLLTGFDSKYLNTLYVDKNLKYHRLIQAFSRTNRVLNDSKPYGNIIDFRAQKSKVDEAIALFSGEKPEQAKEVWLVEPAFKVIEKFKNAVEELKTFMNNCGLECKPYEVLNLQGQNEKAEFVKKFKEVQRYKTQLEQYTDLTDDEKQIIENTIPEEEIIAFRGVYLDTAKELRKIQDRVDIVKEVEELYFELVLFDSALIDYDYIMKLISKFSQKKSKKVKVTKEQIINIISSNAKFIDEKEDLIEYVNTLKEGMELTEDDVKKGYEKYKKEKIKRTISQLSQKYNINKKELNDFINNIIDRLIFDSDRLRELFVSQNLGWKERVKKELSLVEELTPLLKKLAKGEEISGLEYYYD